MTSHLIVCPGCERMLDVTALKLGDQICCICDHVQAVGHPSRIEASGAVHQPALPPIPGRGECPLCQGDLRIHLLEKAEVVECGACGGFWAQRDTFMRMIRGVSAKGREDAEAPPSAVPTRPGSMSSLEPPADSSAEILCVECSSPMQRIGFAYGDQESRIMLDVCRRHGIWFDHAELEDTLKFVQRLGRPFDPAAVRLDRGERSRDRDEPPSVPTDKVPVVVREAASEALFFSTESVAEWTAEFALTALASLFD